MSFFSVLIWVNARLTVMLRCNRTARNTKFYWQSRQLFNAARFTWAVFLKITFLKIDHYNSKRLSLSWPGPIVMVRTERPNFSQWLVLMISIALFIDGHWHLHSDSLTDSSVIGRWPAVLVIYCWWWCSRRDIWQCYRNPVSTLDSLIWLS